MSTPDILIARAQANIPHSYRRADNSDGSWRVAVGLSDSFPAQVDGLLSGPIVSNVTISPRGIDEFFTSQPSQIAVVDGMTAVIFCPIVQPGADHNAHLWTRLVCAPGKEFFEPVRGSDFAMQTLTQRVRDILTPDEMKSFTTAAHRLEIWIRPDWSAAAFFPERWGQYKHRDGLAPPRLDLRTPQQVAEQNRKNALTKKASSQYENARLLDKADAERYAEADRAARARPKKKSS